MEKNHYEKLELSTVSLIEAAQRRGITVEILDWEDNFIRLKKDDKTEYIKQATKTAADSYVVPLLMENKEVTKIVLNEHGISVPGGMMVQSVNQAMDSYDEWRHRAVVVKPKSTNFGIGITILKDNHTATEFRKAVEFAFSYSHSVLLEAFAPGEEYRFLVIGDAVAAILHRVPANVLGDGIHTIRELVAVKNEDPLRGSGYVTPLEKIKLETIEVEYLKAQNKTVTDIPKLGETIYLRENSNISTGGDSLDFTDDIIEPYKDIAVAAAQAVGAKICGVDMVIKDIKAQPDDQNYSIIELNFNPALHIHNYPYAGKNRHVEEKVLDLLGF